MPSLERFQPGYPGASALHGKYLTRCSGIPVDDRRDPGYMSWSSLHIKAIKILHTCKGIAEISLIINHPGYPGQPTSYKQALRTSCFLFFNECFILYISIKNICSFKCLQHHDLGYSDMFNAIIIIRIGFRKL